MVPKIFLDRTVYVTAQMGSAASRVKLHHAPLLLVKTEERVPLMAQDMYVHVLMDIQALTVK